MSLSLSEQLARLGYDVKPCDFGSGMGERLQVSHNDIDHRKSFTTYIKTDDTLENALERLANKAKQFEPKQ